MCVCMSLWCMCVNILKEELKFVFFFSKKINSYHSFQVYSITAQMKSLTWNWACVYMTIGHTLRAFQHKCEHLTEAHSQYKSNMPNCLKYDNW